MRERKVGRNDPCPCGSGAKYKKCHGRIDNGEALRGIPGFAAQEADAVKVIYYPTGEIWLVGSPGMSLYGMCESVGLEKVTACPLLHMASVSVDVPAYVPIQDGCFTVRLASGESEVTLSKKRRGQEQFSSLNTTALPYFTNLVIRRQGLVQDPIALVREVLRYLDDFSELMDTGLGTLSEIDRLSVAVFYFGQDGPGTPVARSIYPLTGEVRLLDHRKAVKLTSDLQIALNRYRLQLAAIGTETGRRTEGEPFAARVLAVLHDFAFFGRQHPEALQQLDEESIRDLCLVPFKAIFRRAEGEVFNFNGKSDIKIVNPENRYEYGIIEFKWWRGRTSFQELFSQLVREHTTGQEALLFSAVLCRNLDVSHVKEEIVAELNAQPETVGVSPDRRIVQSSEIFFPSTVRIREHLIPLTVCLINLYFENVRGHK